MLSPAPALIDSLDTVIAYRTSSCELERTDARTVYGYDDSRPPHRVAMAVPDLAAGPPQVSADCRAHTFTAYSCTQSFVCVAPQRDAEFPCLYRTGRKAEPTRKDGDG